MKKLAKFAAVTLASLMLMGTVACSAAINDPAKISLGKIGKAKVTLADYLQIYQNNIYASQSVPDYDAYCKNMLINNGVILNKCYEDGIKLDDDEKKELAKRVEDSIDEMVASFEVDEKITDETAKKNEQMKLFKKQLKASGTSLAKYKKSLEEELTKTMLADKLREMINKDVICGKEQVKSYFDENIKTAEENYTKSADAFADAYNSYISEDGMIPLYTPKDMFTVKHILVQYENASSVSDTVEGTFSEEQQKKIDEIREALEKGISSEELMEKYVLNKDYNDDPVFQPAELEEGEEETIENNPYIAYREHGYIMNEGLLNSYFDGFGAAACMLHYGEDWKIPAKEEAVEEETTAAPETTAEPEASEEPEATAAPEETAEPEILDPVEKYGVKIYKTTDGMKVAEVNSKTSGGGAHFIFVAEELEEGTPAIDFDNEEDPVYANIQKFLRKQLENVHYTDKFNEWKTNTKINLKSDSYIKGCLEAIMRSGQ